MMNNNTQVSLRNGANFSHIRMAQKGTKIPSLAIGGITHQSGDWYNTIFSSFKDQILAEIAAAKTLEEKQAIIEKYNNQQAAYAKLRPQLTDLSSVEFNQNVKDYQDLINSDFSFINTRGIKNGVITNRYHKVGTANRIGKDLPDNWESDGYGGGQTFDRTSLGYKGDWDETSDKFKTWQKSLNDLDVETYLDTDNAYKLRLLEPQQEPIKEEIKDEQEKQYEEQQESQEQQEKQPFAPVEYEYTPGQGTLGKFRFPTFPLYNGALHGIASLTNKRVLNTKLKAPTMRYQGWDPYAKVTDAYTTRSGNLQALQEYNWGMRQSINNSSDLGKRNEMEEKLRNAELQTKLQNNQDKMGEFNQTTQNFINTENLGKQIRTNVDNQNMQSYVADARDRLNTIAQYQAQQGQLDQENVMANYTDWKAWNRNNQLQDYADWKANEYQKVQQDYQKAYNNFKNSGDLSKYQGYTDFWNNQYASGIAGQGNPKNDRGSFAAGYATFLGKDGQDTDANRLKFFKEHINDEAYKSEMEPFIEEWNKYKSDVQQTFLNDKTKIENRWGLINARYNPINFTGENSAWLWRHMNPAPSYKSIYSMKGGGRFLEYLKHNRRAEKEIRDITMKSMQESRKMLRRDLDALDRESLLLLRAIFK